jgi:hypothetical protein
MGTVANTQETLIGVSFRKQSAIGTGVSATGDFWRIAKTNAALATVDATTESDAADIGKGDEFARNVYPLAQNTTVPIEGYLTSQKLAWAMCFGLGKTTKTTPAAGAFLYTSTMSDPVTDSIEPPLFTYVEQIRPGGSSVVDRAVLDCAINSVAIRMNSGAGRQNSQIAVEAVGSGRVTQPSSVTLPAALSESGLNAGGFGIVINGTNYITAKSFVDCEWTMSKNIDLESGLYPGSGATSSGYQVRGRMEHGARAIGLRFKARYTNGSTELDHLLAQTTGTAVLTWQGALITGSTYHGGTITFHRVIISSAIVGDTNGKVTVDCQLTAIVHPSNGLVTSAIVTNQDNILAAAA